jgi:hypothetical protein
MPFTVSSPKITGVVAGLVFTYKHGPNSNGIFLFVNYTKGDEDGITIAVAFINPRIHATNAYSAVKADASYVLSPLTWTVSATAKLCIPIVVPTGVTQVVVTLDGVSGTENGTITIDAEEGV